MGDRCSITLYVPMEFIDIVKNVFSTVNAKYEDCDPLRGFVEVVDDAVNYGGISELQSLAASKVPLYGSHTSGDSYYGQCFAIWGGELQLCFAMDAHPVVHVDSYGAVNEIELHCVQRYQFFRQRIRKTYAKENTNA